MENQDLQIISNILKQIPLFENLNPEESKEVIKHITLEYFPAGTTIFNYKDPGDSMYIIKNGIVHIFRPATEGRAEESIAMLADNDFFGEMALISDDQRNASAMTKEETQAFKLTKEDLANLVNTNPDIAGKISSEYLKRYKQNLQQS